MSFEAIAAVRKLHEHTQVVPREQLILYVLAGYADMNWESWPSQGRIGDETGFSRQTVTVLPRRWAVERTFAWFGKQRQFSNDYERLPETSEALVYLSMSRSMLKRLAPAGGA